MFDDPFANLRRMRDWAPLQTMRTFQIDQPLDSHYRKATCAEVDCSARAHGWKMGFDLTDPAKRRAARWIKDHSGRTFTFELTDTTVTFTFPAGQQCFQLHRVPLERDPIMIVRGGDWRGSTGVVQRHRNPDDFIDHWATDLDRLNTVRERG